MYTQSLCKIYSKRCCNVLQGSNTYIAYKLLLCSRMFRTSPKFLVKTLTKLSKTFSLGTRSSHKLTRLIPQILLDLFTHCTILRIRFFPNERIFTPHPRTNPAEGKILAQIIKLPTLLPQKHKCLHRHAVHSA